MTRSAKLLLAVLAAGAFCAVGACSATPLGPTVIAADHEPPEGESDPPADAARPAAAEAPPAAPAAPTGPCGDGGCRDGETAASCHIDCAPDTLTFPTAQDDTHSDGSGPGAYFWTLDAYVEGSRTSRLHSVVRAEVSLHLDDNGLDCDTQDVELRINGTAVGTISIARDEQSIRRAFDFQPIAGPTYLLRLHTIRQVTDGCGAASYSMSGDSKVTFFGP